MEWFEDWFDSKFYHILYKSRDIHEAEAFINVLNNHYKFKPKENVLDLACGKGRHAIQLSTYGCFVEGLDLSPSSIKFAKKFENERLKFGVHDMRDELSGAYDYVFNLFTSFGYFDNLEENEKVFRSVSKSLKPGGVFLVDFMNTNCIVENLKSNEVKLEEGIAFKIEKYLENDCIVKEIKFSADSKDWFFKEKVQKLTLENFEEFARSSGLKVSSVFGDYNLNEFNRLSSPRLILEFKKV